MKLQPLIAIINDDPAFLEFMASFLEEETRYRTIVWDDGVGAIPKLREHGPDAVILDVRLGDQAVGQEILKTMRHDPFLRDMPVIVCTADSSFIHEHSELLESLGADVLEKPFDLEALEAKVAAALGQKSESIDPDPVK